MTSFCTGDQELQDSFKSYCEERGLETQKILSKIFQRRCKRLFCYGLSNAHNALENDESQNSTLDSF